MPLDTEVDVSPGHFVLDWLDGDPASPFPRERGTAAPLFGSCLLWPRSPTSATAELFYLNVFGDLNRQKGYHTLLTEYQSGKTQH